MTSAPAISCIAAGPGEGLRLCVVTETYPPEVNGVAMTVARLVRGLAARGHRVQLLRPRRGAADHTRWEDDGLEVRPLPGLPIPFYKDLRFGLPAAATLGRLWRQRRPDLVHVVTEGPLGGSALAAARRLGIPVSSGFHTNFHTYTRHYHLSLLCRPILVWLRRFHNRSRCTLVPTEELAAQLRALGFENLRVLARGVDIRLFDPARRDPALRRRWGAGPDDPVVLYVGRLAAEKNLALAVRAFQAFRQGCPAARFVLVGDGPLAGELRRRHPEFVYAGTRLGEDLAAHYASAELFVFPSLTETFGNVTLEAMASGLAVLAFDYAAAGRHVRHGVDGLKAGPGDTDGFLALARELAADPARLRAMGRQARCTVEPCAWERIVAELEAVFTALAKGEQP